MQYGTNTHSVSHSMSLCSEPSVCRSWGTVLTEPWSACCRGDADWRMQGTVEGVAAAGRNHTDWMLDQLGYLLTPLGGS